VRRECCGRSSWSQGRLHRCSFRAKDGRAYPVARIRAIHPPRPDAIAVALDGGEVVEAWPSDIAELARRPVLGFAAQEGAYVVRLEGASAGDEVSKTAIVGWCVGMDGKTYPVTVNGVNGRRRRGAGGDDGGRQGLAPGRRALGQHRRLHRQPARGAESSLVGAPPACCCSMAERMARMRPTNSSREFSEG